jgi:hypothetical protein
VEDNDHVDVELNLELGVNVRGARVRVREQHVQRYLQVRQHVAICDLDVLDLSGVLLSLKCLHSHELYLNRFNHNFGLLQNKIPVKRLVETTVHRRNLTGKVELGHFTSSLRVRSDRIRSDLKVLRLVAAAKLSGYSATRHFAVKLCGGLQWLDFTFPFNQGDSNFVDDREVDSNITVNELVACCTLQPEREVERVSIWEQNSVLGDSFFLGHKHDAFFFG